MWCFYWKKVSQCVIHAERWMFCLPLSKLTREGADSSASKRRLRSHGCIYECLILIESKVCLIFLLSQELYIGDSSWIVIQSTTGGHICPICPSGVIMWFFLCKSSVADKIRRQQKWPQIFVWDCLPERGPASFPKRYQQRVPCTSVSPSLPPLPATSAAPLSPAL